MLWLVYSLSLMDVYVLFHPNSTHFYASANIAFSVAIPCLKLDFKVLVTSPLGQEVRVNKLYKDYPLVILGHTFLLDLIEMPF